MAFIESHDESLPAGSRDRTLGDDDIRQAKRAARERLSVDHDFRDDESGAEDSTIPTGTIGYHKKVTLTQRSADPTAVADTVILYSKDVSGKAEPFMIDENGVVTQIPYRTGDKLLTSSTVVPSGWTDQSATYNDNFIRISSGTPLTAGGSNTHDHGAVTGSTTLSLSQIPAHTHNITAYGDGISSSAQLTSQASLNAVTRATESAGGGGSHNHSIASANNVPVYIQLRMLSKN